MNILELKNIIETNIKNTQAIVESDDNVHFNAIVISDEFETITNRVKRQQLVYKALGNLISSGEVHALSLQTYSSKSWTEKENKCNKI